MTKVKWLYLIVGVAGVISIIFYMIHHKEENTSQWEEIMTQDSTTPKTTTQDSQDGKVEAKATTNETEEEQTASLMVDIEGAVNAPGVYELRTGQRIVDAIKKAGGLSAHADKKRVNLAQKVVDEMMIYIPVEGETDVPASAQETTEPAEGEEAATKVNINTADLTKLQDIPGIGASKAAAILEYRKEHGAFKKIEDLVNVSGIGEKSLEKMKAVVTLN